MGINLNLQQQQQQTKNEKKITERRRNLQLFVKGEHDGRGQKGWKTTTSAS